MSDREHRVRLPITSRVWFFPALILLTPLLSRACLVGLSSNPRPAPPTNEEVCVHELDECLELCESGETETDTGGETETAGETETGGEPDCVQACEDEFAYCLEFGSTTPPPSPPDPSAPATESDTPTCDPEAGYCGYDESYDSYDAEYEYEDDTYDWTCDSSSDDEYYDDSSTDWSCDVSDDDYDSSDGYSDDGGGFDCSADNYDEGDSDGDDGDWGEDWGERSPGGGDGIDSPADLPG